VSDFCGQYQALHETVKYTAQHQSAKKRLNSAENMYNTARFVGF